MFSRIWAAFGRIADAGHAIADSMQGVALTFRQADIHIRERFGLDAQPVPSQEALPAPPVIEAALPEPSRNGRKSKSPA